jgi:hypothetical protein
LDCDSLIQVNYFDKRANPQFTGVCGGRFDANIRSTS